MTQEQSAEQSRAVKCLPLPPQIRGLLPMTARERQQRWLRKFIIQTQWKRYQEHMRLYGVYVPDYETMAVL